MQNRGDRRLPGSGLLVYGRGVSCRLDRGRRDFPVSILTCSVWCWNTVARHVSINTFSQMTLHSMQRGHVMTRPRSRTGQRGRLV
ncbi:type VI secretion system baseplate subunit TssF [Salmonella enterica subsp. enterica]|nr:type VI secretion system baseplate subunit TssF [Salmonella enterica subsp. enterica]